MDNTNQEIERLKARVDILEQKLRYLGQMLASLGSAINMDVEDAAEDNEAVAVATVITETQVVCNNANPEPVQNNNVENTTFAVEKEVLPSPSKDMVVDSAKDFIAKYKSGVGEYDLYLDLSRDMIKNLKRFPEWNQIPDAVKNELYLVDAYDANMYYADCVQIEDEFVFFVAPAEPDGAYSERDFIRLALPQFFDITYKADLGGKLLKLARPALFVQNEVGGYTLQMRGKLVLSI